MILGIGLDITDTDRFVHWLSINGLPERFFHADELVEVYKYRELVDKARSLAARFAAKEAFGKALGIGLTGIPLKTVAVITSKTGKPFIRLYDKALSIFNRLGGASIHISITHEKNTAAAVVVIEK